jgi:hypothetical protein
MHAVQSKTYLFKEIACIYGILPHVHVAHIQQ